MVRRVGRKARNSVSRGVPHYFYVASVDRERGVEEEKAKDVANGMGRRFMGAFESPRSRCHVID